MMENDSRLPDRGPAAGEGRDPQPDCAPTERRRFPTPGDLLAMLGIAFCAQVLVLLLCTVASWLWRPPQGAGELAAPDPQASGRLMAVTYFLSMAATLAGVLLFRRSRGGSGPVARLSVGKLRPVLLGWALLLMLAVGVVIEPLLALLPEPPAVEGRGWWAVLALVVFAPLFEELLCRGIVLGAVRDRWGVVAAWLLSSLFFGVLHVYPAQVVNAFVFGLMLGYFYIVTDSLWAPVLLHAATNAAAYLLLIWGGESMLLRDLIGSRALYIGIYVVSLCVAAASAWMVRRTLAGLHEAEKNRPAA